eukprot:8313160-Lingulodinium_polyedra.AAC.1
MPCLGRQSPFVALASVEGASGWRPVSGWEGSAPPSAPLAAPSVPGSLSVAGPLPGRSTPFT